MPLHPRPTKEELGSDAELNRLFQALNKAKDEFVETCAEQGQVEHEISRKDRSVTAEEKKAWSKVKKHDPNFINFIIAEKWELLEETYEKWRAAYTELMAAIRAGDEAHDKAKTTGGSRSPTPTGSDSTKIPNLMPTKAAIEAIGEKGEAIVAAYKALSTYQDTK